MTPYTLAQLRTAHFPEPLPIVEGLLNEGETILLVGRPKVGKSRLTQQMTLDLSRGRPFLGHFPIPRARRTALLDLENRPNVVRARFASMSLPDASDELVSICAAETLAEDSVNASPSGMKLLETFLKHANAEVLTVDTWRLFAGGDENDAAVVVAALKALSTIRQSRPQLGTILVHHLRKERTNGRVRLREDPFREL
jgi:RecA-family ATPase